MDIEPSREPVTLDDRPPRGLVDGVRAILWSARTDPFRVTYVNAFAESLLGYPRERWLAEPGFYVDTVVHPADRARVRDLLAPGPHGTGPRALDHRVTAGDGTELWLHTTVGVEPRGRGARLAVVSVDVTDQKRAEEILVGRVQALRARAEAGTEDARFRAFVELCPDGIWCFEVEPPVDAALPVAAQAAAIRDRARLADSNAAFAAVAGARWAARGATLGELRRGEDDAAAVEAFVQRGYRLVDHPLALPDGRHLLLSAVGIVDGGSLRRVWGLQRDVTRLREMEAGLAAASRIEAVARLAGGVAHDFNNILTVIKGSAEMLQADVAGDDPRAEDVREIAEAADRAAVLTRQLLAYSRRQVLQPTTVDLGEVVREMEGDLRTLLGTEVELAVATAAACVAVRVDPGQIGDVIVNLATNARDAMPSGGRVEIAVEPFDAAGPGAASCPPYVAPGRYVALRVRDNGHGMDEETLARALEPFFTTRPPGSGSGLGLATAYGIVKQSGGFLWGESRPGAGTTFNVLLPCADGAAAPAPAAQARDEGGGTVMVVEDEPAVRRLAARILARAGYGVLEASGGEEALALAAAHGGPLHLLLTDVVMPGLSGPAIAERVRAARPRTAVLYMSGYAPEAAARHGALGAGAALLQKPFSAPDLLDAVRRAIST